MTKQRIEEDLLGKLEVPADAYYGIHTQRAIDNFPMSGHTLNEYPNFIKGMVQVKKAEALANREERVLPENVAAAIVEACDLIVDDDVAIDQFPLDVFQGGAGTSVNMNTNEVVANVALETMGKPKGDYDVIHPNDDVNKSQSTNDAFPTGLRIGTYRMVREMIEEIALLADAFDKVASKYEDALKMGRTQLQDAVPMSVGQEFHAFAFTIRQEIGRLQETANLLLTVNLGGTAIGTEVNTPDDFQPVVIRSLAEVTGLPIKGAEDLIAATPDTSDFVSMHSALKRTATKLSKISSDLRLLSSGPRAGFNEIDLTEMAAGSSIMPAKVNPVIPEVVNQVCYKVMGNDVTVTIASESAQLQLNAMEPVIGECLFQSIHLLERAAKVLRERCVDGITVNVERARNEVENSIGLVTYLNDIVGHEEGDSIGKECAETGKTVREVVLERGLLTSEQLDKIFSADNLLYPKYVGAHYA